MVRVISNDQWHPTVIALSRGDVFYAGHVIPDDAERYAQVDRIKSGEYRMVIKKQCIAVVEDIWTPYSGANLVLFMREDRSYEGVHDNLWFAKPQEITNARAALTYFAVPQIHIVTGVADAVVYGDEVLIPDYGARGPYGWVLKREDVNRYIAALPEIRDSGKLDQTHIWIETHVRPGGARYPLIRIEGWSKAPYPHWVNATMCAVSEYAVVFDIGSRIIKCITLTNMFVECLYCAKGPLRGIEVGKRLPTNLGRRRW
ncbi:MAG: hypothetical protein UY31_C0018G0002 [Candidatus Wolfebacteria bacterium GW2011_GWE1_48_7]|uniref:Uncharacterized protein n=2 Tax=Candidatus Wolfeibacteriota TaxID=1752735 RepID=A0A0G1WJR1_9BACT|nr:MAG: hypothetical protein UX70_C0001G0833 [Candidatus Wolfebacteria bacterium GW2011_GWB1_47_1]KKU42119.1 MAG: hypothetical protein UX58_C0003G0043 [Candidatus Wolfebacteria bacterium GW2011_GWB2_46_69]KKU53436.1 MAG: hypothetical protein UX76_C0016G0003 [Candidatus Wolfebacteria bacterium GW2011_GWC1_47_103]KKU59292.1 MAG: hypothetical protein UX83_C0006G0062 [Candidatus Wolfebacteria bacterium GW2011_GWE2_47_12]KKU66044.1 MAG: hypothetical protein UX90_C0001G0103 [Candidatus Wolfebacteria 